MDKNFLIINNLENSMKILKKDVYIILVLFNKFRSIRLFFKGTTQIRYDKNSKNIIIAGSFINSTLKIIEKSINNLIFSFNRLWHVKIKFAGKGFKIKRRRKTKSIKFFFYYSHINVIVLKKAKLKQRKKNKFIIKSWRANNVKLAAQMITSIRNLNIYTKRGIRVSKQVVFRKTGKKSNY